MRILLANWRAALSRGRPYWFALVAVSVVIWLLIGWIDGADSLGQWASSFVYVWLVPSFWWAGAFGVFQARMLTRPFVACLPGYRQSLRTQHLAAVLPAAVVVSLLLCQLIILILWALHLLTLTLCNAAMVMFLTFIAVLSVVFMVVSSQLVFSKRVSILVANLIWVLPWMILWLVFLALPVSPLLVSVVVICVCPALFAFIWVRLGDMERVGRCHRATLDDVIQRRLQRGSKAAILLRFEELFLKRMERQGYLTLGRPFWGGLYEVFGPVLSSWRRLGLAVALAVIMLISMGRFAISTALAMFATMPGLSLLSSHLLLPVGRKERYHVMIATFVAMSLWLAGVATAVTLPCHLLANSAPPTWAIPHAFVWLWSLYLPATLLPAFLAARLFDYSGLTVGRAIIRILAILFIVVTAFFYPEICRWTGVPLPVLFVVIFLVGWVFLLPVLHCACTRWNLITPSHRWLDFLGKNS